MSIMEAMDNSGSRRMGIASKAKSGSVWKNRMKVSDAKSGIKVFNDTHHCDEEKSKSVCNGSITSTIMKKIEFDQVNKKVNMSPKQSPVWISGKRKSVNSEGISPIQLRKRSESVKNMNEKCKDMSVYSDGIKKSPVQIKKTRSLSSQNGTGGNGDEIKLFQLRKVKNDSTEALNDSKCKNLDQPFDGNLRNSLSLQLVKPKTMVENEVIDEYIKDSDDDKRSLSESDIDLEGTEESPVGIKKSRSEEDCEEFGVCQEKAITSNVGQNQIIKTLCNGDYDNGEEDGEEIDKGIGDEKNSLEIEDINISVQEQKPKKLVIKENKFLIRSIEKPVPISPIAKKQSSSDLNHARIHPTPTKKPKSISDHFYETRSTHSKYQSFVDLIMWRDASKSSFILGVGAFVILSSSYTKDVNISFISVVSYLGLVYLAAVFLFKSLIRREVVDMDNTDHDYVVGEEKAIWLIKLVLPHVNDFLLKLRDLFCGDPATTMKLAVILFFVGRFGGSITIWKMAKLGFFGVFMVPKLYSGYSSQLAAYGTFWIRRFEDAWKSCTHKKAVGFGIFTIVWNLCSVVARIWTIFILFVALKYYHQQSLIKQDERVVQEEDTI